MIDVILIVLLLGYGLDSIVITEAMLNINGSEFLQKQRQSRIDEINNDPVLKENILKMLQLEVDNIIGKTGTMEALINRSVMTKGTIKQELFSGFYGPVNRGRLNKKLSDVARQTSQSAFDNVASGSNVIKSRTDQGMIGDPNSKGPGRVKVSGTTEIFNHWTGQRRGKDYSHAISSAWSKEQERQIAASDYGIS